MQTKTKNIVVSIAMIVFFLGISIFSWLKPIDEFSYSERRNLAQFPEFTLDNIRSGKFATEFEVYSLDQFPLRERFRTLKAITSNYVFAQLDNNKIYLKDGYVSKMEYPLNEQSLTHVTNRFCYVYDKYFEGTNVNVYLSIIPDKNYYLEDKTRLGLDYDKMINQVISEVDYMEYIDISDTLSLDSFYKTDTHWRQEKLLPTAQKLAEKMGITLSSNYNTITLENDFYGVYYGQAALPLKPDTIKYLNNDVLDNVKVYDYQNSKEIPVYDMTKAFGKDPYEMFLSGPISLISIENDNSTTDKELVIFRDSFGSSITPLLVEGYKKITLVDIRYIHPNIIEKFVEFDNQDVLFLYSTLVLNNGTIIK